MRQQNFHKKAHTARFLQTFHSGISSTGRDYRAEMNYRPEVESEAAAVSFVKTGQAATFAAPTATSNYVAEYRGIKVTHGEGLITEAQAKYVVSIALDREGVTPAMLESLQARLLQGFAKSAASQFISTYKDLPRKSWDAAKAEAIAPGAPTGETPERRATSSVADGRYAVEHEGTLKFFKVKNGRKPGFVFLDVQASDDWHSIRNVGRIAEILALIAADADEASLRYGRELGVCGDCGRTLTDETSRARGRGPVCDSRH
jgi:hypothetical protein